MRLPLRPVVCAVVLLAFYHAIAVRAQQPGIEDFFNRFTADWVRINPNQATATRYFVGAEQDALESQLTPVTQAWREQRRELARRGLAELARFDRNRLTESQRVSADLMKWQLDIAVEGGKYEDFVFPLEQFAGVNVDLPNQLAVVHPLVTEKDAEHYVARLRQVAARMQEATAEAVSLAEKRMVPPKFIIAATIAQIEQFISTPPAQNPFVSSFVDRTATAPGIPPATRERLRVAAEEITASQIYPAWRAALTALRPLESRASDAAGLSRFPGGIQAYNYQLRRFTSTTLGADEIHQIGLREVARIESEMDALLKQLGRSSGSLQARIDQLEKDSAYPLTEEGRAQIMRDIDGMMRDAQQRSMSLFIKTPKAPVVARPYPKFREASAAASYNPPSPDGSRPGTFQIPLRPSRMTKFGLRTLVYHETVPGHHFQVALDVENHANPRFRQIRALGGISAFSEGWGLYAERLAAENGGTTETSKGGSGSWTQRSSARDAWWWTRASTPRGGRGSRRSTTASKPAKSSATSSTRARPALT